MFFVRAAQHDRPSGASEGGVRTGTAVTVEPLAEIAAFLALGAIFGFLGGLFGIGGGIIAIPILGIFFGLNEQVAQGTALVMIVPNATVGLWRYLRAVRIDLRIAGMLLLSALPFTYAGSRLATELPSNPLRFGFAVFLIALAGYLVWSTARLGTTRPRAPLPWPLAGILGAFTGLISGLFSIGGAIFSVPVLTTLFGLTQLAAQATALAFATPGTLLSLAVYGAAADIRWEIGIPLAIGGVSTVSFGVALARRLPDRSLRYLFAGFLLLCSAVLFLRTRA